MQHLPFCPKKALSLKRSKRIRVQVRFLAYHRIKPHAPPLVRTPVNSFEFHRCRRTPQVENFSVSLGSHTNVHKPSSHRLRRGLPGYLILFAPHAFVPQCQITPSKLPSPSVFLLISVHFTATRGIPPTHTYFKSCSIKGKHGVKPRSLTSDWQTTCAPFKPNNSGQRLHPPYYRGCWHGVSRCLFLWYRQTPSQGWVSSHTKELYDPKAFIVHAAWLGQSCLHCPIFPTAASRRSLARISVPVWGTFLSEPLPIVALVSRYLHQLANGTHIYLIPINL